MKVNINSFSASSEARSEVLQRYIDQFRQDYKLSGKSIGRDDDILYGLRKAYVDMGVRNIPGHKAEVGIKITGDFVKVFRDYFSGDKPATRSEFNEWHGQVCIDFLTRLNKELSTIECGEQCYGRAQKFINMTFKYLYCYDDACKYEDYFAYCHMPLDRFTTDWLFCEPDHDHVSVGMTWSRLSENGYCRIQESIQSALDAQQFELPTKPLLADFMIWGSSKERELKKPL